MVWCTRRDLTMSAEKVAPSWLSIWKDEVGKTRRDLATCRPRSWSKDDGILGKDGDKYL